MCVVDVKVDARVNLPLAMKSARFCFSPRGWDNGDSDRYLPALFYGCIPVMSDPLEAMPLHELAELRWEKTVLAIDYSGRSSQCFAS